MTIMVFEIATSLKIDQEHHTVQFMTITSAIPHEKHAELSTEEYHYKSFANSFSSSTNSTIKTRVASPFPDIYDTYLLIQPLLIQQAKDYFSNVPSNELLGSVARLF
jgi:hypothetical protein